MVPSANAYGLISHRCNIGVCIAEDHQTVSTGLRLMLETRPDLEIVCDASDGSNALQRVDARRLDVLLLRHFHRWIERAGHDAPLRMSSRTVAIVLASKNAGNYPDEQSHDAGERDDRSRGAVTRNRAGQTGSPIARVRSRRTAGAPGQP